MNLVFKNFTLLSEHEHKKVLSLRNADEIRKNMKTTQIIELHEHIKWVKNLKNDKTKLYYAIFLNDEIIGSINLVDIEDKEAFLGLYFSKNTNPLNSSLASCIFLDEMFKSLKTIQAEVLKQNKYALSFDKSLGFEQIDENKSYIKLILSAKKWEEMKRERLKILIQKIQKIDFDFKDN